MDKRLKWGLIGVVVVGVILLILWAVGVLKKKNPSGLAVFGQIQGSELSVDYSTNGEMRAPADVTVTLSAGGETTSETIHAGTPVTGHIFLHIPSQNEPRLDFTVTLSGGLSDSLSATAGPAP